VVDSALDDGGARPAYIVGWVGCVRVSVAACVVSAGAVMPQEGAWVLPQVLCSEPIVSVGPVGFGWPTWIPGGGVVLVVVVA
jgi:hypothetical protein